MMNNLDWNEFCELYYDVAKRYAAYHLARIEAKGGSLNRRIDKDYVVDAAVLAALEKTYSHFDAARGSRITTYLSNLVHNEVVDVLRKESRAANVQATLDDVKAYLRTLYDEGSSACSKEAVGSLLPLLKEAVGRLSPSDQVILAFYLEDKASYITKSAEALHVERSYVSLRVHRIMKLLPKLMGMNRSDYLRICEQYGDTVFAGNGKNREKTGSPARVAPDSRCNYILPSLDVSELAVKLLLTVRPGCL